MGLIEKLKWLENDDTLFHYTKANTAINHILPEMRLLFNKFSNFSDIREKMLVKPLITMWEKESKDIDEALSNLNFIEILKKEKENKRVACFCSNITRIYYRPLKFDKCYKDIKDLEEDKYNFENKGCYKSRMWDQYADGYKGVCLVFTKDSLNESLKKSNIPNFYGVQINYTASFLLSFSLSYSSSDIEKEFDDFLYYIIEHKSIDYKGESEFRFVVDLKDKDEDFYLDISNSLKAVIMGPLIQESQKNCLKRLLKNYNNNIMLLEYKINNHTFDDDITQVNENN